MTAFLQTSGQGYDAQQSRAATKGIEIPADPVNIYQAEIEEFSQAILAGRPTTLDGELGLRSQAVLFAAYESARTGEAVKIAELVSESMGKPV
jgi:predicted dehydrogenase